MKIENLECTCGACPSQWEFKTDDNRMAYVRYRWGYLSVRISEPNEIDAVEGIEILGREIGDKMCSVIDWDTVEGLIKDIHIENTLASHKNNK